MKIAKIINNDLANGPGLRTSIFVSGCNRHCKNCHNSHLWDFSVGVDFEKAVEDIYNNITANGIQRKLSILGGEPLDDANIKGVLQLCKELKNRLPDLEIWLWTGYEIKYYTHLLFRELTELIDAIVDGPYEEEKKAGVHPWRGSSNQKILFKNNEGIFIS